MELQHISPHKRASFEYIVFHNNIISNIIINNNGAVEITQKIITANHTFVKLLFLKVV